MLCSLFIGGAMVSCAEDYMETDKGHDTLTLTVNQQEIVLNEKNHSQEALTLSWTTGTNYGSGNRISYTLEIAKAGTDFTRAYSVDLGTGTYQWTKKTEELNQFLNTQLGVGYAEKVSLEARSKVRTLKYRIRTEIIRFYLRKSNSISFSFLLMLLL